MARILSLFVALTAVGWTVGCGGSASPFAPTQAPVDNELYQSLQDRQNQWCVEIAGRSCFVLLSTAHPEYAAWVDWDLSPPPVFWNERVLTDRQFWITDPRMAHEACHLRHGLQPTWSLEQMEDYADRCAVEYAGAAP
jgi:hypothetical protein